jgi:methionyl-tRNA formyltransferase
MIEKLRAYNADLFVVVSFGQILKAVVLNLPKIYAINLHTSLLPRYRGAAPVNWAIINGESKTGVTIIRMNEFMDQGEIILQKEVCIEKDDTAITLGERLSQLGADLILQALELIEEQKATLTVQTESESSYAPKLKKGDGLIDWNQSAYAIHNRVRGVIPWPGAFTYFHGKILKVWKTEIVAEGGNRQVPKERFKPGEVIDVTQSRGIVVSTGEGSIIIKVLQLEGGRKMDAGVFILGHKVFEGTRFG